MAGVRLIPNQSVAVARPQTGYCSSDVDYCQPVADDQITQVQFEPLLVNGANLIADEEFQSGVFWNSPSGFVPQMGGGALVTSVAAGPSIVLRWLPALTTINNFYKITFTYRVDQLDAASLINITSNVDSLATSASIRLVDKVIGVTYTETAYLFHDTAVTPGTEEVDIELTNPSSGSAIVFFESIQVQLLTLKDMDWEIQDCDGNLVDVIEPFQAFIADPTIPNYVFLQRADTVGYAGVIVLHVDWSSLNDGCYKICWRYSDVQDECSECFTKGCAFPLLTVTYSNNSPAFGFFYSNAGAPAQQISFVGAIGKPNYPDEINDEYLFGNGSRISTFIHTRKIFTLSTLRMPEWMHDAIKVALCHENLTINGVAYHKLSGGYSPDWDNETLLASVEVEIEEKTQNTFGAI